MSRSSGHVSSVLSQWISDYCAPVVGTLVTNEVERICLKNGLLFHELLSAFGHLDGIHATVRANNQLLSISDAKIRFEKSTEMYPKSSANIEELLKDRFEEFDINDIPSNASELRSNPPSAWTPNIEKILTRSMSFSESEMLSHPTLLIYAVATSERDVLAAMQEIASAQNMPACLQNGQFDPDIIRVYLLLHDGNENAAIDSGTQFRKLQSRYPPVHCKMLTINSLSAVEANLHQPDMWSRYVIPLFYKERVSALSHTLELPINPINGSRVLGSRLSMEDFMSLRDFCIALYHQDIVPSLERRILYLTKIVTDARKGVKNVLKSFWRKPREEVSQQKGVIKYRFDRIEAQILLLADTCFIIRDYEAAISMYKLVKDDYRADKSFLHLAHCTLMSTLALWLSEPGRRDLPGQVEYICQSLQSFVEPLHSAAFFAFMVSELLLSLPTRMPLECSQLLLQSVGVCSKQMSVMSALLTERCAVSSLIGNQLRKYSLHELTAGLRFHNCGMRPQKHAIVCFALTLLIHDTGSWGGIKSKLVKYIADDWRLSAESDSGRPLLLLLKVLSWALDNSRNVSGRDTSMDAVRVLGLLCDTAGVANSSSSSSSDLTDVALSIAPHWDTAPVYQLLLKDLSNIIMPATPDVSSTLNAKITVNGLAVPYLDTRQVHLMMPVNGFSTLVAQKDKPTETLIAQDLSKKLEIELDWRQRDGCDESSLIERLAKLESEKIQQVSSKRFVDNDVYISLGEPILVSIVLANKLACELHLTELMLELSPSRDVRIVPLALSLGIGEIRSIQLQATPTQLGSYKVEAIRWNLSPNLAVRQPLAADINRTVGREPMFKVVASSGLLRLSIDGLQEHIVVGECVPISLLLTNEGFATAADIHIRTSENSLIFPSQKSNNSASAFIRKGSGMAFSLEDCCVEDGQVKSVVIAPGHERRVSGWLRINELGAHSITVLISYYSIDSNGGKIGFPAAMNSPRTCSLTFTVHVTSLMSTCAKLSSRPSLSSVRTCVLEIGNNLTHQLLGSSSPNRPIRPTSLQTNAGRTVVDLDYTLLNEGDMHLNGVFVVGAKTGPEVDDISLSCAAGESLTLCFPVGILDKSSVVTPLAHLYQNWMFKNSIRELIRCRIINDEAQLLQLIEICLCTEVHSKEFSSELRSAFVRQALQEQMESAAGPRSISQVRKDRDKEREHQAKSGDGSIIADNILASFGEGAKKAVYSDDLIQKDVMSGKITLISIFSCIFKGKVRFGVHILQSLNVLQVTNSLQSANLSSSLVASIHDKAQSEFIQISCIHVQRAVLSEAQRHCDIAVQLHLHNLRNEEITVTVEAIDRRSHAVEQNTRRPAARGIRWDRKTRYCNVPVEPLGCLRLEFHAIISKPGVFDLKRFKIAVLSPTLGEVAVTIPGQSLIEIVSD